MKCPFAIKVCTKCKRILVAYNGNFAKKKSGKWGLRADCKKCINKYNEEYYIKNKNEIKIQTKEYNEKNKENIKEKRKQYYKEHKEDFKKYKESHKNEIKKWRKKYYKENREKILEHQKQYARENPDKLFNRNHKRRQLEEQQGKGVSTEQWYEMMMFFNFRCAYSGEYIGNKSSHRTIDHIIPLVNNGEHEIWNCVPMYDSYNYSKGINNMEDWYMQQEFFDIDRLLKIYDWIEYAYNKWGNK